MTASAPEADGAVNHGRVGRFRSSGANATDGTVNKPAFVRVSRHPADVATNFGLVFSLWDRLLGTYRSEPEYGEDAIEFGIDRLREPYFQRLDRMLWLPFVVRENI